MPLAKRSTPVEIVPEDTSEIKDVSWEEHLGPENPLAEPVIKRETVDLVTLAVESNSLIPIRPGDILVVLAVGRDVLKVERRSIRGTVYSGNVMVDMATGMVMVDEKVVFITALEWDLLRVLCSRVDIICDKDFLCKAVWGDDYFHGRITERDHGVLRVLVQRLRQRLPKLYIETINGIGYMLVSNGNDAYWERLDTLLKEPVKGGRKEDRESPAEDKEVREMSQGVSAMPRMGQKKKVYND